MSWGTGTSTTRDCLNSTNERPGYGQRELNVKKNAVRIAAFLFCASVAIDTIPESYSAFSGIKAWIHPPLVALGISQGDWPLFAPNPVLNNGVIVA